MVYLSWDYAGVWLALLFPFQRRFRLGGGLIGAAMVSDAFFPFRDGVDVGLNEKISCVVQPGGSANDYQSIQACNDAGVTMVYTGQRSFKH